MAGGGTERVVHVVAAAHHVTRAVHHLHPVGETLVELELAQVAHPLADRRYVPARAGSGAPVVGGGALMPTSRQFTSRRS